MWNCRLVQIWILNQMKFKQIIIIIIIIVI